MQLKLKNVYVCCCVLYYKDVAEWPLLSYYPPYTPHMTMFDAWVDFHRPAPDSTVPSVFTFFLFPFFYDAFYLFCVLFEIERQHVYFCI